MERLRTDLSDLRLANSQPSLSWKPFFNSFLTSHYHFIYSHVNQALVILYGGMSRRDDDLLARLNALKPSSVTIKDDGAGFDVPQPRSASDKLAERLKGLRAGAISPVRNHDGFETSKLRSSLTRDQHEAAELDQADPIRDWQRSGKEDQSLEDLIAELGPSDQWELDPDDPKNIRSLLDEAGAALPAEDTPDVDQADREQTSATPNDDDDQMNETSGERRDDEEADDYVKRILEEVEYEKKYGVEDEEAEEQIPASTEKAIGASLDLPSTPLNALQSESTSEPPSYEDSELEARFSNLGLNLRSTPTSAPSVKAKATSKAQARSSLPTYSNDDIDSWCCICNEDGEVKCLGCDNDIYCHACWAEGHGKGPGQERGHRAVQFIRKGPATAAA